MDQQKMFPQNKPISISTHHKPVFCLFGRGAKTANPHFSLTLLAVFILPLAGCSFGSSEKKPERNPYADRAPGVFNDDYNENADIVIPDADFNKSTQWSIILASLPNAAAAQQALSTIRSTHGLLRAFIDQRDQQSVVAYGHYEGPNDKQAKLDLDRLRTMQSGQSRPFASAYLAPPPAQSLAGSNAEHDLRTVSKRYGPAAIYTLQIGVYGNTGSNTPKPSEIKEFRLAAERAVLDLRSKEERAFYYHAPFRSMVTIGIFGENDFDASITPPMESLRLRELRKRFPHNYLNGQGINESLNTDSGQRVTRLQPSSLVGIPTK